MAKKRMLADVLWEAANVYLCHGNFYTAGYMNSCIAAKRAYSKITGRDWMHGEGAAPIPFLKSLGCEWDGDMFCQFLSGEERQGVRYMWLLLAMHVAEDEGIEI